MDTSPNHGRQVPSIISDPDMRRGDIATRTMILAAQLRSAVKNRLFSQPDLGFVAQVD